MILENIKSIGENLVDRIRNPFSGAFLAVWTIQNWELVYSIMNFDDAATLDYKVSFINTYLANSDNCQLFWFPLANTFIAIITYLILVHLSLIVYTFFRKWVTPGVYLLIDRNKISSIEEVKQLRSIASRAQKDFESTRGQLVKSQEDNSELRRRAIESDVEKLKIKNQLESIQSSRYVYKDSFNINNAKIWSRNYWGKPGETNVCRIENNMMVFEIKPSDTTKESQETGAYLDVIGGINKGEIYLISVLVSAEEFTTMLFKLWVHDTLGNKSSQTEFFTPPTEDKIESIQFEANETNAIRVHLHCKAGRGKICVKDLSIQKTTR